jgi:hypothetical protein
MRTLKKVLALSMVFAMAFSMMAGAAFNDQDQIDASLVEDIQLLTALEVFQGDEKGDFNPTANVTRAQAAKMIYVLKNNGQDDEAAAFKGNSVYSDVPSGHWAEGYINYATNLGIMSGWTEGSVRKFDPNGNVTGIELTKMLLCMIGYRADIQGYTGNGWQTNVLRDGATSAVTTNYLPTIYNASPRQWTARLMANAINAPYVSYSRGEVVQGSATDATVSYGEQYLGLRTVEGYLKDAGKVSLPQLNANANTGLDEDGDEIVVAITSTVSANETVGTKQLTGANRTFKTTVDPMLLGQHVKVYYKATNTTTSNYKVYSVLPTGKSKVYDVTLNDVTIGKNAGDAFETIKFDGYNGGSKKQYRTSDTIYLVKNLDQVTGLTMNTTTDSRTTAPSPADDAWKKATAKNFAPLAGRSNEAIRFVDQDNDGYIDLAFTNDVNYYIVNSHNSAKNSIRFKDADNRLQNKVIDNDIVNSEAAYKKINFVDEVVADDVVSVTLNTTSGKKVWDIAKIEPQTGSVTGYTLSDDEYNNITLNGETTKIAKKNILAGYDIKYNDNTHLLNDTTFYTDGKFIIYSKGGSSVASVGNLALIVGKDSNLAFGSTTHYVKVVLSDGTTGQYEVEATNRLRAANAAAGSYLGKGVFDPSANLEETSSVDNTWYEAGDVVAYSISNNKITLSQLQSDSSSDGIQFGTTTSPLDYNNSNKRAGGYVVAEDAYFFIVGDMKKNGVETNWNDRKFSVVKASELNKSLTGGLNAVYATKKVNNINSIVFGVIGIDNNAINESAKYAFVKSAPSVNMEDGKYVTQLTVVLPDGTEQVIKKSYTTASSAYDLANRGWSNVRGTVVTYDLDADGDVSGATLTKVERKSLPATIGTDTAAEGWYAVRVLGWNGTVAQIDDGNDSKVQTLNIASDAKIHIVDTADESYAQYSDGSVSEVEKDEENKPTKVCSALIYVENVGGNATITHVFSEEDGKSVEKLWR